MADSLLGKFFKGEPEKEKPVPIKKVRARTYQEDVARAMREGKGGTMARVLSEARGKEKEKKEKTTLSKKNIFFGIASLCLVILTIGVFAYLSMQFWGGTATRTIEVPSLVRADIHTGFDTATIQSYEVGELVSKNISPKLSVGQIQHMYFVRNNQRFGARDLFTLLDTAVPASLTNALENDFMFGVLASNNTYPFLILKAGFYDTTFDGMKEWERTMLDDLSQLFVIDTTLLTSYSFQAQFEDMLVNNKEARVLRGKAFTEHEIEVLVPRHPGSIFEGVPRIVEGKIVVENVERDSNYYYEHLRTCTPVELRALINEKDVYTYRILPKPETSLTETETAPQTPGCVVEIAKEKTIASCVYTVKEDTLDATYTIECNPSATELIKPTTEMFETLDDLVFMISSRAPEKQIQKIEGGNAILLMYLFLDEHTLLITTNENVVDEIIKRYANRQILK